MNTIIVDRDIVQQALDNYHEARSKAIAEYKEAQEKASKTKVWCWDIIPFKTTLKKKLERDWFYTEIRYYEAGLMSSLTCNLIRDRKRYYTQAMMLEQLLHADPDSCPTLDADGCRFVNDWKGKE